MSAGVDPTSPPQTDDPRTRELPRVSNITLSEPERRELLESIDRQIAEIESHGMDLRDPPADGAA